MHYDICGPMQTSCINGCKYFVASIDDYTRKTWVYFSKHKYDAFSYFSVVQGTRGEPEWTPHQDLKD